MSAFAVIAILMLAKEISGIKAGLVASLLYAVSFELTVASRNILDPYPVVYLLIPAILFLIKAFFSLNLKYLLISWLFFMMSLMYISVSLLLPPYFFAYIYTFYRIRKKGNAKFLPFFVNSLLIFTMFYFPVIYYHFLNNFKELYVLPQMFIEGNDYILLQLNSFLNSAFNHFKILISGFFQYENSILNILLFSIIFLFYFNSVFLNRQRFPKIIIGIMFFSGIILTGIFPGKPMFHRLIFLFPLFIIIFSVSSIIISKKSAMLIPFIFIIILFVIYNNSKSISFYLNSNRSDKNHRQRIAQFIKSVADKKSFTLFTSTPDENTNYYSLEYLYALRQLKSFPVGIRMDVRGELYYNFNPNRELYFLICKEFSRQTEITGNCLNPFLSEYKLNSYILKKNFGIDTVFAFNNSENHKQ